MPTYTYQVRTTGGKKMRGALEDVSEKAVADRLMSQGYLVTSVKMSRQPMFASGSGILSPRVAMADLTMFYFQLGNMFEAGVSLMQSLRTARGQIKNRKFAGTISDLANRIEQGESFSEALGHHPQTFPSLYRIMVQAGETSGNLGEVLRHIADLNERSEDLRHQVRSALAYPAVLVVASIGVVIFMMVWIVPSFTAIFERSGIPLPLPTRILANLSLFMKSNIGFVVGGLMALFLAFRIAIRKEAVKYHWDRLLLAVPVAGLLLERIEISRWSRSMALMLSSGVPILKTLEVTSNLSENRLYQLALGRAYTGVQGGEQLAETLTKTDVIPEDVVQMIATGEQSGTLDQMLRKVAQFYDQLIQRSIKKLTAAIEPVFIVFMGVIVGFIMLSLLLPIFDMLKLFQM